MSKKHDEHEEIAPYATTWRNKGTDEFNFFSYSPVKHDSLAQASYIEQGNLRIYITGKQGLLLAPSEGCKKIIERLKELFAACNTFRSPDGARQLVVELSIEEYMRLCGVKKLEDKHIRDNYRKKIKKALDEVADLFIEWRNDKRGEDKIFGKCRIIQAIKYKMGVFRVTLGEDYAQSLINGFSSLINHEIYKLDERNPSLQALAAKLSQCASMNREKRKHIISLAALLKVCRAIPSFEKVEQEDRHYTRRIIEPFEDAMHKLSYISWHYCNAKGKPLTEKQLAESGWSGYKDCMVEFEMIDAPIEKKAKSGAAKKPARKSTPKAATRRRKKSTE